MKPSRPLDEVFAHMHSLLDAMEDGSADMHCLDDLQDGVKELDNRSGEWLS